jgi:hypothetical protein
MTYSLGFDPSITTPQESAHASHNDAPQVKEIVPVSSEPMVSDEHIKNLASIYATAMSAIRYLANGLKRFFGVPQERYLFGPFKLVAIIPVALAVESLAKTAFNIGKDCWHKVTVSADEVIDTALNIIGTLGTLGDYTSTFAEGLAAVKVVAIEAVKWSTPLLLVSLGLEAIGMVYNIKACVEGHFFAMSLKKEAGLRKSLQEYTPEDYQKGLALIKQESAHTRNFVGKQFGVDDAKLMERLDAVGKEGEANWQSTDPEKKAAAQKLMYATMTSLRERVISTKLSHALSVVATTIGILAVLSLFTPAAPAGYLVLAGVSVYSIATIVNRMIETRRFEEAMKL